ncbi:MAG: hypothetical protein NZ960_00950 [Candidatus Kapabacteria bacterium]|nr:hypothetical protein [Candidatus Kapabacteria bacterium]MDW8011595.1 hypothetical protein [Bacteroidota bacterium]
MPRFSWQGLAGLAWCGSLAAVASTQVVEIPDTVLQQGQRAALPIRVQLELPSSASTLRIAVAYSAYRLKVVAIRAGGELCGAVELRDTLLDQDTGRVDIYCTAPVAGSYRGVLGWLEIEVLAGREGEAWFFPVAICVDSVELPVAGQKARIRIENGPPVEPIGTEGLWKALPSPFGGEVVVQYSVARPGWVFFQMFSATGKRITLDPSRLYAPRAGTFALRFRFYPWEVSSGAYVLQMQTEHGTVDYLWMLCVR